MEIPAACPAMADDGSSTEYGLILSHHCWADAPIPGVNGIHYTMCFEQVDPTDPVGLCKIHAGKIIKPKPLRRWVQPDVIFYEDDV